MRGETTTAAGQSSARLPAAHRGADAERLRLVACGENDAGPDDDRPALEGRVVALLDRGVEGVGIGMQDHERMFAQRVRGLRP